MSNITLLILSYVGAVVLAVAAWLVFKYVKNNLIKTFGGGALICATCVVFFSSFNTIQNITDEKKYESKQEVIIDSINSSVDSLILDSIKWN